MVRGRVVDVADVERYADRKKLPAGDSNSSPFLKALHEISCRTPSPQSALLLGSSVTPIMAFRTIAAFVDGTLGTKIPVTAQIWSEGPTGSDRQRSLMLAALPGHGGFKDSDEFALLSSGGVARSCTLSTP